jgi:hypothetical protein
LQRRQRCSSGPKYMIYILGMGRIIIKVVHGRHRTSSAGISIVSNYCIVKPRGLQDKLTKQTAEYPEFNVEHGVGRSNTSNVQRVQPTPSGAQYSTARRLRETSIAQYSPDSLRNSISNSAEPTIPQY